MGELLPSVTYWEIDGVLHLLRRLSDGLKLMHPIAEFGIGIDAMSEARQSGKPAFGSQVQTFLEEFKELSGMDTSESSTFDKFISDQLLAKSPNRLDYLNVGDVIPPTALWVQAKYS